MDGTRAGTPLMPRFTARLASIPFASTRFADAGRCIVAHCICRAATSCCEYACGKYAAALALARGTCPFVCRGTSAPSEANADFIICGFSPFGLTAECM